MPEIENPSVYNYIKQSILTNKLTYTTSLSLSVIQAAAGIVSFLVFYQLFSSQQQDEEGNPIPDPNLPLLVGLAVGTVFVAEMARYFRGEIIPPVGSQFGSRLGQDLVEAHYHLPLDHHIRASKPTLLDLYGASTLRASLAYVNNLQIDAIPALLEMLFASVALPLKMGPIGTAITTVSVLHALVLYASAPKMAAAQNVYIEKVFDIMNTLINQLGQYKNIKIFNAVKHQLENLATILKDFGNATDYSLRIKNRVALIGGLLQVGALLTTGLIMLYDQNIVKLNDFLLIFAYLAQLNPKLAKLNAAAADLVAEGEFLQKAVQFVETGKSFKESPLPDLIMEKDKCSIEFDNVSLTYPGNGQPALKNVSFKMNPGETMAIIGESGGGKTSALYLLTKFYKPDDGGVIKIQDQNLQDVSTDSVRGAIGFVPQDVILFNDSLFDNVKFAKPTSTDEEVYAAITKAGLRSVAAKHGIKVPLGAKGDLLSGGEKQRVTIARLFLSKPKIILLDEFTSALDVQNTTAIINEICKMILELRCVAVFVTHNPEVPKRLIAAGILSQIIVMHDGAVMEQGTPQELRAKAGYALQMGAIPEQTDLSNFPTNFSHGNTDFIINMEDPDLTSTPNSEYTPSNLSGSSFLSNTEDERSTSMKPPPGQNKQPLTDPGQDDSTCCVIQ